MTPSRSLSRMLGSTAMLILALATGFVLGHAGAHTPAKSSAQAGPNRSAWRLAVPLVGGPMAGGSCAPWISLQNVGTADAVAVVVTWMAPGAPGGACAGPADIACTGLLTPGAAWSVLGDQLPDKAGSAMVFSFGAQRLSDIGVSAEEDDIVANYLCTRMRASVVGDCAAFAEFAAAAADGQTWGGVPLDRAAGAPIAADVLRTCDGRSIPGTRAAAGYSGIGANVFDTPDSLGGYRVFAAPVDGYPTDPHAGSLLHVQNAGTRRASATVWAQAEGDCAPRKCLDLTIEPGESAMVPGATCADTPWRGGTWVTSDVPVAAVVEMADGDMLTAYEAVPAALAYDASGTPLDPAAGTTVHGPLMFVPDYGWDTSVTVQNLSDQRAAAVTVTFLDRAGAILDSIGGPICAGGAESFRLAPSSARAGMRVGRIVVSSGEPPGGDPDSAAPIAAVAHLTRFNDEACTEALESTAYRLQPQGMVLGGTGATGAAAVALPRVLRDLDFTGITSELAVANLVAEPGWTDLAILVYDQNALLDTLCRRLGAGQVAYLDLATSGAIGSGLRGSAVVSATWWAHPGTSDTGQPTNAVALAAAALWRGRTQLGQDVPGDESALTVGVPLARAPAYGGAGLPDPCGPAPGPRPTPSPPPPPAEAGRDAQIHIPAYALREWEPCGTEILVRNVGRTPGQGVLMAWLERGSACPPDCAGPAVVECTGLLAPGGTWANAVDGTLSSASLFSFTTATVESVGGPPGATGTVSEYLCATLRREAIDNCEAHRRFKLAFDHGEPYAGVQLDRAWGPAFAVDVTRTCDDIVTPGATVTARYAALTGDAVLTTDPTHGGYRYAVSPVVLVGEGTTALYIQNAGSGCARVDVALHQFGDCLHRTTSEIFSLAPGEVDLFRPSDVVGPGFAGYAILSGTEPLAVVAETVWPGRQVAVPASSGTSPFDLDGDGRLTADDMTLFEAAYDTSPGESAWNARADFDASGAVDAIDREILAGNMCGGEAPSLPDPPLTERRSATQVQLPALASAVGPGVCDTWVAVQNAGTAGTGAVLLTWGEPAAAGCVGPLSLSCTGLIRPGRSWHLKRDPSLGEKSGTLFSFTARTLADVGATPPADELVFDAMCRVLANLVGDCPGYRTFAEAFAAGATYGGVPLDRAAGAPLVAHVARSCDSPTVGAGTVAARYAGVGSNALSSYDPARGGYHYDVPMVYGHHRGAESWLHLQNAGTIDATVQVRLHRIDDCGEPVACPTVTVPAGARALVWVPGCSVGFAVGTAEIASSGPLAVVADTYLDGTLSSNTATAARVDYDAAAAELLDTAGHVLYGPLFYDPEQGWDVSVVVRNRSAKTIARVRAEFLDGRGAPIDTLEADVCVRSQTSFYLPLVDARPGDDVGTIRVTSLPAGDPPGEPAPISASVHLARYANAFRSETDAAASYDLLPEASAMVWPNGGEAGGTSGGIGVVAIPDVDLSDPGAASHLAIANLVTSPGWTNVAVLLYDRDNLVHVACRGVEAGHVEIVDLGSLPLPVGFRGSAIISATAWRHPVPARPGQPATNALGLAAAVAQSDRLTAEGDSLSIAAGAPLRALPWAAGTRPGDLCTNPPTPVPTSTARPTRTLPPTPTALPKPTTLPTPSPTRPTPGTRSGSAYLPFAMTGG